MGRPVAPLIDLRPVAPEIVGGEARMGGQGATHQPTERSINLETPTDRLISEETVGRVLFALRGLSPRVRLLVELVYLRAMPIPDAARVMGMKTASAEILLRKVRQRLGREDVSPPNPTPNPTIPPEVA